MYSVNLLLVSKTPLCLCLELKGPRIRIVLESKVAAGQAHGNIEIS